MRGPRDSRLDPEPPDPVQWTPPKFLRRHAAHNARRRRLRRAVVWIVLGGVGFGFVLADGGLLSILKRQAQVHLLHRQVRRLEAQQRALEQEIELRRDDPQTIERLAREEYGMIYAGERVVRIVEVSEEEAQRVEAAQERWLQQMFETPAAPDDDTRHDSPVKRRTTRPATPQR